MSGGRQLGVISPKMFKTYILFILIQVDVVDEDENKPEDEYSDQEMEQTTLLPPLHVSYFHKCVY